VLPLSLSRGLALTRPPAPAAQIFEADLQRSVDSVLEPEVPLALRLSGQLLLGIVRVYGRKVGYLLQDCSDALVKLKQAQVKPGAADLAPDAARAPVAAITLPTGGRGGVLLAAGFDLDLDLAGEGVTVEPVGEDDPIEAVLGAGEDWGGPESLRRISEAAEGLPVLGGTRRRSSLHAQEAGLPERFADMLGGEGEDYTLLTAADSEPEILRSTARLTPERELILTPASKIRAQDPLAMSGTPGSAPADEMLPPPMDSEQAEIDAMLAPPSPGPGSASKKRGSGDLDDLLGLPDAPGMMALGPEPGSRGLELAALRAGRGAEKRRKLQVDEDAEGRAATVVPNAQMRRRQDNWRDTLRPAGPAWQPPKRGAGRGGAGAALESRPATDGGVWCPALADLFPGSGEGTGPGGEEAPAERPRRGARRETLPEAGPSPGEGDAPPDMMPLADEDELLPPPPPMEDEAEGSGARRASGLSALGTTTEEADDAAPDGWSQRTHRVLHYLKGEFEKLGASQKGAGGRRGQPPRVVLRSEDVMVGQDRRDAARIFFELLVLRTKGYVDIVQPEAYGNMELSARAPLLETQ